MERDYTVEWTRRTDEKIINNTSDTFNQKRSLYTVTRSVFRFCYSLLQTFLFVL